MTTKVKSLTTLKFIFYIRGTMHNQHKILRVLQLITLLKARPAKSIRQLGEILSSSDRTVYRYLDLLEELGFIVQRDSAFRVYIETPEADRQELVFTGAEAQFLHELLLTIGKKNKLSDAILKKLYVNSDIQIAGNLLLRAHLGQLVQKLNEAIQQKKQVILKQYHSANSNGISDRIVEPIRFTDNYENLVAYEINTGKNKYFNIERITAVAITKNNFKHATKHKYEPHDVFGFALSGKKFEIDLTLSLRACVILREEYPLTSACIKRIPGSTKFRFKTTVYDLKPVSRFILGFLGEIKINGSSAFKNHIREQLAKHIKIK